jgi:hypothetical protein
MPKQNCKLLAIGDSSSIFFSGWYPNGREHYGEGTFGIGRKEREQGFDEIPGIETFWLGPMRVGNYNKSTSNESPFEEIKRKVLEYTLDGFNGFVMVCGGHLDLGIERAFEMRRDGVFNSISNLVNEYVLNLIDLQKFYGKICVWGPAVVPRTNHIRPDDMFMVTTLFNKIIRSRLPKSIQYFSLFQFTHDSDGRPIQQAYHHDRLHLSPNFLPLTLKHLINRLDLKILLPSDYEITQHSSSMHRFSKTQVVDTLTKITALKLVDTEPPFVQYVDIFVGCSEHFIGGLATIEFLFRSRLTKCSFDPEEPWTKGQVTLRKKDANAQKINLRVEINSVLDELIIRTDETTINIIDVVDLIILNHDLQYCRIEKFLSFQQKVDMLTLLNEKHSNH